jgi:hypothetical protein
MRNLSLFFGLILSYSAVAEKPTLSSSIPFIKNEGQWDNELLFKADFQGGQLRLFEQKLLVTLLHPKDLEAMHDHHGQEGRPS